MGKIRSMLREVPEAQPQKYSLRFWSRAFYFSWTLQVVSVHQILQNLADTLSSTKRKCWCLQVWPCVCFPVQLHRFWACRLLAGPTLIIVSSWWLIPCYLQKTSGFPAGDSCSSLEECGRQQEKQGTCHLVSPEVPVLSPFFVIPVHSGQTPGGWSTKGHERAKLRTQLFSGPQEKERCINSLVLVSVLVFSYLVPGRAMTKSEECHVSQIWVPTCGGCVLRYHSLSLKVEGPIKSLILDWT